MLFYQIWNHTFLSTFNGRNQLALTTLPDAQVSWPERGVVAPGLILLPSSLMWIHQKEEGCFISSPVSSLTSILIGGGEGQRLSEEEDTKSEDENWWLITW